MISVQYILPVPVPFFSTFIDLLENKHWVIDTVDRGQAKHAARKKMAIRVAYDAGTYSSAGQHTCAQW